MRSDDQRRRRHAGALGGGINIIDHGEVGLGIVRYRNTYGCDPAGLWLSESKEVVTGWLTDLPRVPL
jgi:hypothetical protein